MWKSSFIQFFKIIGQNKFFTFLNLFGVSVTIVIILLASIRIEKTIWPGGPEKNNDKMLHLNRSTIMNESHMMSGGLSQKLVVDQLAKVKSAEAIGIYNETTWSYFGDQGVEEYLVKNTNAGWWKVFDYEFVEGSPFTEQHVQDAALVAVIDTKIKNRFFPNEKATGKMLEISGKSYKITGVIKEVPENVIQSRANSFMPYTQSDGYEMYASQGIDGGDYSMTYRVANKNDIKALKAEVEKERHIYEQTVSEDGYKVYFSGPNTPYQEYLMGYTNADDYIGHTGETLKLILQFLLIMLLPAINLISIQLIRIHERSEEIGIRKAFGASRSNLIRQILYENTLLTLLGAILGLIITAILVYGFRDMVATNFLSFESSNVVLGINYRIFFISLIASLMISLLSGLIPAIKMARMQAVTVLKGGEL
jgi:putative ABC transport system permease protein